MMEGCLRLLNTKIFVNLHHNFEGNAEGCLMPVVEGTLPLPPQNEFDRTFYIFHVSMNVFDTYEDVEYEHVRP